MTLVNIKDTYLHVPIFLVHQQFPRIAVGPLHYQFMALPFNLHFASSLFNKVLAPVLALLHFHGITIVG